MRCGTAAFTAISDPVGFIEAMNQAVDYIYIRRPAHLYDLSIEYVYLAKAILYGWKP